jgi:hypothetical protein
MDIAGKIKSKNITGIPIIKDKCIELHWNLSELKNNLHTIIDKTVMS